MPGGPIRRTPEGALAPSLVNLSGDLSNSYMDTTSSFDSVTDAGKVRSASPAQRMREQQAEGYTQHNDILEQATAVCKHILCRRGSCTLQYLQRPG